MTKEQQAEAKKILSPHEIDDTHGYIKQKGVIFSKQIETLIEKRYYFFLTESGTPTIVNWEDNHA